MSTTDRMPIGSAVLVHGTWGNPADWQWTRRLLEERGVHVETPDLPSHRTLRGGLLDDAEEVRQLLRGAPDPVVAVGWSYGGDVVGVAAADIPQVVRLVIIGAAPLAVTELPRPFQLFDAEPIIHVDRSNGTFALDNDWFVYEEKGTTFSADVQEHLRQHRRRPAPMRIDTDPVSAAAWTSIPTTVLLGRDDELVSADERRWIAENVDDFRQIDDDHFILFNHPEAIADIVIEALAQAGEPGNGGGSPAPPPNAGSAAPTRSDQDSAS